MAINYKAIGIY